MFSYRLCAHTCKVIKKHVKTEKKQSIENVHIYEKLQVFAPGFETCCKEHPTYKQFVIYYEIIVNSVSLNIPNRSVVGWDGTYQH